MVDFAGVCKFALEFLPLGWGAMGFLDHCYKVASDEALKSSELSSSDRGAWGLEEGVRIPGGQGEDIEALGQVPSWGSRLFIAAGSNVIGGVRGRGLVGRVGRRISVVGPVLWVAASVSLQLVRATAVGLAVVCL